VSRLRSRFARNAVTATRQASPSLTGPVLLALPELGQPSRYPELAARPGGRFRRGVTTTSATPRSELSDSSRVHHLAAADAVEVAGRLVGGSRSGRRPARGRSRPLLLDAGQLVRRVVVRRWPMPTARSAASAPLLPLAARVRPVDQRSATLSTRGRTGRPAGTSGRRSRSSRFRAFASSSRRGRRRPGRRPAAARSRAGRSAPSRCMSVRLAGPRGPTTAT